MLDAHSKLLIEWIEGFLVGFLNFTTVLNMNSRDFKRKSLKNVKRSKSGHGNAFSD